MGRVSMPQGKGSLLHNRREYEKIGRPIPDHIDINRSHENVTLVDMNARQAYKEIFGEALREYNDKQKRADRRIEDYYDHIQKSKNGEKIFYEDVVQWGAKEDFADPEIRQKAKEALIEYVRSFEARNLNLKLIGAYVHMDEASPHLHIDYVPIASGYSRGLSLRNSLDRAMKELGFTPEKESRKNNATKLWKENERAVFGEICRSHGLEVEAERKARGSLSVEEYKEARDAMLGKIEQDLAAAEQELASTTDLANEITGELTNVRADLEETSQELTKASKSLEAAKDELESSKSQNKALKAQIGTLQRDVTALEGKKGSLEADVAALETKKETLTAAEVEALKGTKTLTGGLKGVTYTEFEALKRTAARVEDMEREVVRVRQEGENVVANANRQLREKQQELQERYEQMTNKAFAMGDINTTVRLHRDLEAAKKEASAWRRKFSAIFDAVNAIRNIAPTVFNKIAELVNPKLDEIDREDERPNSGRSSKPGHDDHDDPGNR